MWFKSKSCSAGEKEGALITPQILTLSPSQVSSVVSEASPSLQEVPGAQQGRRGFVTQVREGGLRMPSRGGKGRPCGPGTSKGYLKGSQCLSKRTFRICHFVEHFPFSNYWHEFCLLWRGWFLPPPLWTHHWHICIWRGAFPEIITAFLHYKRDMDTVRCGGGFACGGCSVSGPDLKSLLN